MSNMHRLNDTSRYPYTFIANYSQIYNDLHMFFSVAVLFEHGKKKQVELKKMLPRMFGPWIHRWTWENEQIPMFWWCFFWGVGGDFEYWVVLVLSSASNYFMTIFHGFSRSSQVFVYINCPPPNLSISVNQEIHCYFLFCKRLTTNLREFKAFRRCKISMMDGTSSDE